jgi:hypothetical protein
MVIPYQCFGTTYQPHLQGSRNPKQKTNEVNWHNLLLSNFEEDGDVRSEC